MITNEKDTSHHVQQSLCTTRPLYRQGRRLTAVKVYTVTSESQHLYIYGVPKINLRNELKSLCTKYGQIHTIHAVEDVETEAFTECYHVNYQRIQSARIAKKLLDNKSFYGGVLHVCYTPEHESMQELKYKLEQRRYDVLKRLHGDQVPKPNFKEVTKGLSSTSTSSSNTNNTISRKRKRPAVEIKEERMANVDPMIAWLDVPKRLDPKTKTESSGDSIPKKHELNSQPKSGEQEHKVERIKIAIKTKAVYGPQLPINIVLNQSNDFDDNNQERLVDKFTDCNRVLIPTQVVMSKEYIYKNIDKKPVTKKIVFRKTK